MPVMSKKMVITAFTCYLLILVFFILGEVSVIDCLFVPLGVFQFYKKFQIDSLHSFHLSHESEEQHNMITLKKTDRQTK
jgi:hypothetical protein